jgi:hypothetical protein
MNGVRRRARPAAGYLRDTNAPLIQAAQNQVVTMTQGTQHERIAHAGHYDEH